MATTIITLQENDQMSGSRADINSNFDSLNTNKIETSYLDTDTSMAANSDTKIPSQKAVKTYIDTQGGANASTTARGIVEEATSAEMISGSGTGATGARLFINPTLVAETGADKIVKTKSTGLLDTSILPGVTVALGTTTRAGSAASGDQVIPHGLGVTPKLARFHATVIDDIGTAELSFSNGGSNGSTNACVGGAMPEGGSTAQPDVAYSGAYCIAVTDRNGTPASNDANTAVATFDSTNITLTWTKVNTGVTGTIQIYWEAFK